MPYADLKCALLKREGGLEEPDGSVSFLSEGLKLNFAGTGQFYDSHEYVSVKLDGRELELSAYLSKETPRLWTGEGLISNTGGQTNCIHICERILKEFRKSEGPSSCAKTLTAEKPSRDKVILSNQTVGDAQPVAAPTRRKPWWRFW